MLARPADGRAIVFARAISDGTIQLATDGVDGGSLLGLITTGFGSSAPDRS